MPEGTTSTSEGATATAPPSGGRSASEFRDIADSLRNRTDVFGKTLGAVATLGTTAVGLSRISELYPVHEHDGVWVVAACIGLAAAALAAIGVAVRLMWAGRPVFINADLENPELDESEREKIKPVFHVAARRFGYETLLGLEQRERVLRSAASQARDEDERTRRTALADEAKTEIEQALGQAQVVVVRQRTTNAVNDWSWVLYLLVIGGLILFALGADRVSGDRTSIADAKACGEARKEGATPPELEKTGVCSTEGAPLAAKPPSEPEARAQIDARLAGTLEACAALVAEANSGPLRNKDCDPIRKALSEIDPKSRPG